MGLWNRILGKKSAADSGGKGRQALAWLPFTDPGRLESILADSHEQPQLLFKHSTSCGISRMVLGMFEREFRWNQDGVSLHFIDLWAHRPVSDHVAQRLAVHHQSPQLIVIVGGEVVATASHGAITDLDLDPWLPVLE